MSSNELFQHNLLEGENYASINDIEKLIQTNHQSLANVPTQPLYSALKKLGPEKRHFSYICTLNGIPYTYNTGHEEITSCRSFAHE